MIAFDNVPDLGPRSLQINIKERRILSPATCEAKDGGATIDGCDVHLQIIDIATGTMYLVPLNPIQLENLRRAL